MDFDSFVSTPRWKILEIIAKQPSSPLEISQELNTSVSYVSQQLKLLEVANIVEKSKTGMAEKGKPRNVFSLTNEIVYITNLMNGFPAKKLIYLEDYRKTILRIWLIADSSSHYLIEKFYWKIEDDLNLIHSILFDSSKGKPKLIVFSDSKAIKGVIDSFSKKFNENIEFILYPVKNFANYSLDSVWTIYVSQFDAGKNIWLKGGKKDIYES